MASLYTKTKLYLEANSKTWDAEEDNIILQKGNQIIYSNHDDDILTDSISIKDSILLTKMIWTKIGQNDQSRHNFVDWTLFHFSLFYF